MMNAESHRVISGVMHRCCKSLSTCQRPSLVARKNQQSSLSSWHAGIKLNCNQSGWRCGKSLGLGEFNAVAWNSAKALAALWMHSGSLFFFVFSLFSAMRKFCIQSVEFRCWSLLHCSGTMGHSFIHSWLWGESVDVFEALTAWISTGVNLCPALLGFSITD